MEEQIREKPIELNHDARRESEPDGGEYRGGREELLHGF
jgi:hypothetical protein